MKILHIINNLSAGGAEKLILETLPIYRKKGIDVHLLLLNNDKPAFYDQLKKTACCPIYILSKSSVYSPFLIFKIIPFLRKFDLLHVHLFPSLYWVALAKVISFSSVKLCFTEHGTTNRRRSNPFFKPVDWFIYGRYHKIFTVSREVDQTLRKYVAVSSDKIRLIANGINLEMISKAKPYQRSEFFEDDNSRIIIQVSRFYEPKDQATVIKSLDYLPGNVKLILVGDGALLPQCKELTNRIGLEDRVVFTGVRLDVPHLLKTADIVVLSSKHEGLSLACLEGMASGRPFIASNVPGITDIVKGAGILFPAGNAEALARVLNDLLADENLYQKTVTDCLERASQYDVSVMTGQYIDLWKEMTAEAQRRRER